MLHLPPFRPLVRLMPERPPQPPGAAAPFSPAIIRLLLALPWVSLTGLLGGYLLFPALLKQYAYLPLLLSVVLFGLPHGALDHLIPIRQSWKLGQRWTGMVGYLLAYLGVVVVYLMVWKTAPLLAFWAFLLASVMHWGHGDLDFLERALGRRRTWHSSFTLLLRGSLPIVLPFLAFPDAYERLARGAAHAFNVTLASGPLWTATFSHALSAAFWTVLCLSLLDTLLSASSRRAALLELLEVPLLLAVFWVVPAELSIGLYFTLWHAWRHLGRLLHLNAAPLGLGAATPAGVRQLVRDLTPITLLALVMLVGLYFYAAPRIHSAEDFAALYLALVAAMTLPHALVVAAMDDTLARWVRKAPRGR